jgi:hypothetical protein
VNVPKDRLLLPFPALLAALLAAPAAAAAPPGGPPAALLAVSDELARAVGAPADGRRGLVLAVEARARPLQGPLETALAAALARQGYAVAPARGGGDPEAAARAGGQDWLLRVQAGLVPGRRELALVGEVIPAWDSFFLQRRPGARARPPRLVQARGPADPETLLLGREERPGAPAYRLVALGQVTGRVLALAAGDAGEGPALAAATPQAAILLSPQGTELARREPDRAGWRAVRDPAAVVALGDFGGGRLAVQWSGAPQAEVLARRADRLEVVATLAAAPLCASEGASLFGRFAPGQGLLLDELSPWVDPETRPRSDRTLYGVAAAPRGGPVAFAALDASLRLELLGPDLAPVGPALAGVGVGFALADLDGDGTAEVVASSPSSSGPDRIRLIALRAERPVLFESPPLEGAVLAAAGGDLTGDGVDDAVVAVVSRRGDGEVTDLLLLTTDPRELR